MILTRIKALFAATVFMVSAASTAGATVLTFEGLDLVMYDNVPQGYGDRVAGTSDAIGNYLEGNGFTPHVDVAYQTLDPLSGVVVSPDVNYGDTDFGNLVDVAFPDANLSMAEITLTALPGYRVTLNSFNLAAWPHTDVPGQAVRILDGDGNALLDLLSLTVLGAPSNSFFLSQVTADELHILFGPSMLVGIDNINFDEVAIPVEPEVVPEPATIALLGIGLAFMVRRANAYKAHS